MCASGGGIWGKVNGGAAVRCLAFSKSPCGGVHRARRPGDQGSTVSQNQAVSMVAPVATSTEEATTRRATPYMLAKR